MQAVLPCWCHAGIFHRGYGDEHHILLSIHTLGPVIDQYVVQLQVLWQACSAGVQKVSKVLPGFNPDRLTEMNACMADGCQAGDVLSMLCLLQAAPVGCTSSTLLASGAVLAEAACTTCNVIGMSCLRCRTAAHLLRQSLCVGA